MKNSYSIPLFIAWFCLACACSGKVDIKPGPVDETRNIPVEIWTTRPDGSAKLLKEAKTMVFSSKPTTAAFTIEVDPSIKYQQMDGFGYTLTGGSAMLINQLPPAVKQTLLNDLFGTAGDNAGIGVSYLRLSMGASDLDETVFSYNDLPSGQTDINQQKFSVAPDKVNLIPVLKEIFAINPQIKIIATPWSAPAWMKDNNSPKGGKLKTEYFASYAIYFVKYVQAMKAEGINITAITPQNEPLHDGNNPSMYMSAEDQRDFIKNHLGPAFAAAGITTKIIVYDHNADNIDYARIIYNDADAGKYVDGAAFHLYAGSIGNLSVLHNNFPSKNIYFTEQWAQSTADFGGDLKWHMENIIIGAPRNWAKVVMQWNLANDPNFGPHTPGGCTQCKGAITISGAGYEKNVAYFNIAHASKFVPQSSQRIESSNLSNFINVCFLRPDGKKALIVFNKSSTGATFYLKMKENGLAASVPMTANSVITVVW